MATQLHTANEWTRLTSKGVRQTMLWVMSALFLGGGSLLSLPVFFLKGGSPTFHTVLFIFWAVWLTVTGLPFFASLAQFFAKEPTVLLSRAAILSGQPVTLRWELPAGMRQGAIEISLCGQEECSYVVGTQAESDRATFLKLILASLPENSGQREGVINFQRTLPMHSFKAHHNKIRYWIGFRNSRGVVPEYEYEIKVEL
jgi:hypothetical protein